MKTVRQGGALWSFALKPSLSLSMLFDHVYHHPSTWNCLTSRWRRLLLYCFPGPVGDALSWFAGFLILALPYLGLIAAPIFLFCIANRHTRSVKALCPANLFVWGAGANPLFPLSESLGSTAGEELYIP